jgi:hypothetical protein
MFSWPHYPASFQVKEEHGNYFISMQSDDNHSALHIDAILATTFPADSMFDSLSHASDYFECCAVGVSRSTKPGKYQTITLKTKTWTVKPLEVRSTMHC